MIHFHIYKGGIHYWGHPWGDIKFVGTSFIQTLAKVEPKSSVCVTIDIVGEPVKPMLDLFHGFDRLQELTLLGADLSDACVESLLKLRIEDLTMSRVTGVDVVRVIQNDGQVGRINLDINDDAQICCGRQYLYHRDIWWKQRTTQVWLWRPADFVNRGMIQWVNQGDAIVTLLCATRGLVGKFVSRDGDSAITRRVMDWFVTYDPTEFVRDAAYSSGLSFSHLDVEADCIHYKIKPAAEQPPILRSGPFSSRGDVDSVTRQCS